MVPNTFGICNSGTVYYLSYLFLLITLNNVIGPLQRAKYKDIAQSQSNVKKYITFINYFDNN